LALIGFNLPQKGVLILIIGLLEVVPYLWPILGSLPAVLMGLMLFGWKGLIAVVIAYTIIQQSEWNIVVPVLMSKTLWINATLVFVCMLFGGLIMGFLWVLLSVPIAVIISIIYEKYQKEKVDTLEKNPLKQKKVWFKKQ
jgi:predicted PurR-regulated permease PerM